MFEKHKLEAHLEELIKKHRKLDLEISNLSTHHISVELRQLKTHKLWYKDEIHRIQKKLEG